MYQQDDSWNGFTWCSVDDNTHSVLAFLRIDRQGKAVLCCFNFTPVPWEHYMMGMPEKGSFTELLSSDAPEYGGTGNYTNPILFTETAPYGEYEHRLTVKIPPYGAVFLAFQPEQSFQK